MFSSSIMTEFQSKLKLSVYILQGRIQDFHLGGVRKIMCPHIHYERTTELTFGRGPGPA